MKRVALALPALIATLVGVAASPAHAAPTAARCAGVWVVVGSEQRCATSHGNGEDALASAGFEVARSGGLVCRIDRRPDRCVISSDAYWSYWHAEREPGGGYGPWVYSTSGAAVYQPGYGDAEGWVFGDGDTPPARTPSAGSVVPSAAATAASPVPEASGTGSTSSGAAGLWATVGVLAAGVLALAWALARRKRAGR